METSNQILLQLAQSLDTLRDDLTRLSLAIEDVALIVDVTERDRALHQVHELLARVADFGHGSGLG